MRSVLCSILCNNCVQCNAHTQTHTHMNIPNSCLLVRFRFSVVIFCVTSVSDKLFRIILCSSLFVYVCFYCVTVDLVSSVPCQEIG